MKIKLRWQTKVEVSYEKTFDLDEKRLPDSVRSALNEAFDLDDGYVPILDEWLPITIDEVDELADDEDDHTEYDYAVTDRFVESVRFTTPTREELGIPGVVHVSEALGSVDQALERADDIRDEERNK